MTKRLTARDLRLRKRSDKIVSLTAYTAPMATLLDPHVDFLLVGDTLGMTIYGLPSTLDVSVEMMIAHGQAVMRGSTRACVVIDLPFGSYQRSKEQAFDTCCAIMKATNCGAVKMEGGEEMAGTIAYLTKRGIPVMAHIGLMPQHVQTIGGFRTQGTTDDAQEKLIQDALLLEQSGAFAIVLEAMKEPIAKRITEALTIPTIGIGASPACDGQVLVIDDMLGMFEQSPKFVKHYANSRDLITNAAKAYAKDVKEGTFPSINECYT